MNAGVADFAIGFGDSVFAKYDRESLTMAGSLGKKFGTSLGKKPIDREKEAERRRAAAKAGVGFSAYLSFAASIGAGSHKFEVSAAGSGSSPDNWGVDITFGITSPADAATPGVADSIVNGWIASLAEALQKIASGAKTEQSKSNIYGKVAQVSGDVGSLVDAATQQGLASAIKSYLEVGPKRRFAFA